MRRRRPRLPTPAQFDTMAAELREDLEKVRTAYRWTHSLAYGSARKGWGDRSGKDPSDPTGAAATSNERERYRRNLARASRHVSIALGILDPSLPTPPNGRVYGLKVISDKEYEDSRKAQRRREGRGEGWGEN